jgi:hypothetical protein
MTMDGPSETSEFFSADRAASRVLDRDPKLEIGHLNARLDLGKLFRPTPDPGSRRHQEKIFHQSQRQPVSLFIFNGLNS